MYMQVMSFCTLYYTLEVPAYINFIAKFSLYYILYVNDLHSYTCTHTYSCVNLISCTVIILNFVNM